VPPGDPEEEEEGIEQKPGTYMVLHDGMAVRSGVSISSQKIRTLRRGEQVRIIEVFEYKRQGRVRGRLEPAKGSDLREWISLRDMEDDYWWVKRVGPLKEEPAWVKQARYKRQGQRSNLSKSEKDKAKKKKKVVPVLSPEDSTGAPPYDPDMYEDAWVQQQQVALPSSFNGTMQARDVRMYCGKQEKLPAEKEVQGGMATSRGEWRLGFAEK